jgi:hypothetical protein
MFSARGPANTSTLFLVAICLTGVAAPAWGQAPAGKPPQKKVLIIGIDGCRPDALLAAKAPHLHGLIKNGAFSDKAQTGDMTASGSGWGSLLTGVWREKHGVRGNDFKLANFGEYPDLLLRIKKARPTSYVASIVHWDPIQQLIVKKADVNDAYKTDAQVSQAACKLLSEKNPDLLFVHLDDVDGAGHKYGFDPKLPKYLDAIAKADEYVGDMLQALEKRPTYREEDWLVIVSTDHGGSGKGHGANIPEHRTIFLIVSGPSAARGTIEPAPVIVDIVPTAFQHLGIPVEAKWGLDGKAVGLKAAPKQGMGPRYRFPEIMVIVYADFPNEPEHQLAIAKYTAAQGFNCVEAELDKLEVCRQAGLRVRLGSIDVNKLLQAAPKLKDDPAVLGYFVSDRRTSKAFPGFANTARAFEAADPNHPTLFINRAEYNQFPEFVNVVKPMVLDYYHYHWWPKNHPERYFLYLRMFRDLSVKHDIPQMRCLGSNNSPEQIRQSMYVSLAYGVQAFHFWPPWFVTCKMDKDRNAVLDNGKPVFGLSDAAKTVSAVALELKAIGPVLLKLKNHAVYHTDKVLPAGAEKAPADLWFQPEGETCLVSVFHDEQKGRYLMPVNHAVDRARELTVRFRDRVNVELLDRKTAQWRPLALETGDGQRVLRLTLAPGDGELLRVNP